MFYKLAATGLVVLCHVKSICIVGCGLPGLMMYETPSFGSAIAVAASTLLCIQYILPGVQMKVLPPLMAALYKLLALFLWSNVFYQIMWIPVIAFIGAACETLGKNIQIIPGFKGVADMSFMGAETLEIILALYILYVATKPEEIIEWMKCKLTKQKRGGARRRNPSRRVS